jgi:hypothetical protein
MKPDDFKVRRGLCVEGSDARLDKGLMNLARMGLIEEVDRGYWTLTPKGRTLGMASVRHFPGGVR